MEQSKDLRPYLDIAFSNISWKPNQSSQSSKELFQLLLEFVHKNPQCTFGGTTLEKVKKVMAQVSPGEQKTSHVIFKCEVGSAVLVNKKSKEGDISVQIITPGGWEAGASSYKDSSMEPCNPRSYTCNYVTDVEERVLSLDSFAERFENELTIKLREKMNRRGSENRTSQLDLEEAVKEAVRFSRWRTIYYEEDMRIQDLRMKNHMDLAEMQSKKVSDRYLSSKETDLTKTKANTSWFVIESIIRKLLAPANIKSKNKMKRIVDMLIISFKGYLLQTTTKAEIAKYKAEDNSYSYEEIGYFKKCLNELIYQYRNGLSRSKSSPFEPFKAMIQQIYQNIVDSMGGKLRTLEMKAVFEDTDLKLLKKIQSAALTIPQPKAKDFIARKDVQVDFFPFQVDRRTPFEELLDLHAVNQQPDMKEKQFLMHQWVLLVEKTIFELASNLCDPSYKRKTGETIDLRIHMREIECQMQASNLCKLVRCYEKEVRKNPTIYGMGLKSQTHSHICLVQTIGAIIAFESVKLNREKRKEALRQYRVPIDIDTLGLYFKSLNDEAVKAMQNVLQYHSSRKYKKMLFLLDGGVDSFLEFARNIASENRDSLIFKKTADLFQPGCPNLIIAQDKFCQECQNLLNLQGKVCSGCSHYAQMQKDPQLYSFLHTIPYDILGLMKISYIAQNPIIQQAFPDLKNASLVNQTIPTEEMPIKIFSHSSQQATLVKFEQNLIGLSFQERDFFQACQSLNISLHQFITRPFDTDDFAKDREHRVYAKQNLKPIDMKMEEFLAIANTRAAQNTQLALLCENIFKQKIIVDCYNEQNRFCQEVFLHTASQLSAYNPQVQGYLKNLQGLFQKIINVCSYAYSNFIPLLAPFLAGALRKMHKDKLIDNEKMQEYKNVVFELARFCSRQLKKGEQDAENNRGILNSWRQRFLCAAVILCFREIDLEPSEEQQIKLLAEFILQYENYTLISLREARPAQIRPFETEMGFSLQRTVYRHIQTISEYFITNPVELTTVLRKVYEGVHYGPWSRKNVYHFTYELPESRYDLNLYNGTLYVNGKMESGLSQQIKGNRYFKEMFGPLREFQVSCSSSRGYLRTRKNINSMLGLPYDCPTLAFFQFSEDGQHIRIIMVEGKNEECWDLVTREDLKKCDCFFPQMFLENYLPWICRQRQCIIFRGHKFELDSFNRISLVAHLQKDYGNTFKIHKSFFNTNLVSREISIQSFHQLLSLDNPFLNEELVLRPKRNPPSSIKIFSLLSKFEKVDCILELKSKHQHYILLPRYQLRFRVQDSLLVSESYNGYYLNFDYMHPDNKTCLYNYFDCLVLQKDPTDISNNHERMILISDGQVRKGKIIKPDSSQQSINVYKYLVHDYFGDIRGATRASQMHLAMVLVLINDNMRIQQIGMSPVEYAIYILKACLTNRPFSIAECRKLEDIIKLDNNQIMLLCEVLWKCSNSLQKVLPFYKKEKDVRSSKQTKAYFSMIEAQNSQKKELSRLRYRFTRLQNDFNMARTLYQKNSSEGTLNYNEILDESMLRLINIRHCNLAGSEGSESEEDERVWVDETEERRVKFSDSVAEIKKGFLQLMEQDKKLNQMLDLDGQQPRAAQSFLAAEDQEPFNLGKSALMKEKLAEVNESYSVYHKKTIKDRLLCMQLNQDQFLTLLNDIAGKCESLRQNISKIFDQIKIKSYEHCDVISGHRPVFQRLFFTQIISQNNKINDFFPFLAKPAIRELEQCIKIWIGLGTRLASIQRIKRLFTAGNIAQLDLTALRREVNSPRAKLFATELQEFLPSGEKGQAKSQLELLEKLWVCFEAENKVQVWPEQYQVFNHLTSSEGIRKRGSFCQLNMGEGKTQIIIPMIVLWKLYNPFQRQTPRINLLSSLFEEARANFFRFLSVTGFKVPGFELPFTREVHLSRENIFKVRDFIGNFSNSYILVKRESRLSQILRYHELSLSENPGDKEITIQKLPMIHNRIFDIFDEIDEMMTPKKFFIYSVGKEAIPLPSFGLRLNIIKKCLEIMLNSDTFKEYLIQKKIQTDEGQNRVLDDIKEGRYPKGLRLMLESLSQTQLTHFKKKIVIMVLESGKDSQQFNFYAEMRDHEKEELLYYILDSSAEASSVSRKVESFDEILTLRGLFAYGIFEHCLSMRCGVNFGAPGVEHEKTITVPYEKADTPSATSEFEHPEVSALFTYISYFVKGLTRDQFRRCLNTLQSVNATIRDIEYQKWLSLKKNGIKDFEFKSFNQVNPNSEIDFSILYEFFRDNRATVSYWLIKCIFPSDLKQYVQSLTSSAFDLANVQSSIGFTGTPDCRLLFPHSVTWDPTPNDNILATDGKMIYLAIKHTKKLISLVEDEMPLWQRFITKALENEANCIIDAGALCVGRSLKHEIVPWLANHELFRHLEQYKGISFCNEDGQWMVYELSTKRYLDRGSTIPDHETFAFFDEARSRGADLNLHKEAVAALSLCPNMAKPNIMQAIGRLRRFGRKQSLIIMGTQELLATIPGLPSEIGDDTKSYVKSIIAWSFKNTVDDTEKLLIQYARLGWEHAASEANKTPNIREEKVDLKSMYEGALTSKTVSQINIKMSKCYNQATRNHQAARHVTRIIEEYGQYVSKDTGAFDNICEREVQLDVESTNIMDKEDRFTDLFPIKETNESVIAEGLEGMDPVDFSFDPNLAYTVNFLKTTLKKETREGGIYNELPDLYFIKKLQERPQIVCVSLREASMFLQKLIDKQDVSEELLLLSDVNFEKQPKELKKAIVHARFFGGETHFPSAEEQELLRDLAISTSKKLEAKKVKLENEEIMSAFLTKRRVKETKYSESSLDRVVRNLNNVYYVYHRPLMMSEG